MQPAPGTDGFGHIIGRGAGGGGWWAEDVPWMAPVFGVDNKISETAFQKGYQMACHHTVGTGGCRGFGLFHQCLCRRVIGMCGQSTKQPGTAKPSLIVRRRVKAERRPVIAGQQPVARCGKAACDPAGCVRGVRHSSLPSPDMRHRLAVIPMRTA